MTGPTGNAQGVAGSLVNTIGRVVSTVSRVRIVPPTIGPGAAPARSSGPFLLPSNAVSLDWVVLNSGSAVRSARVTVYRLEPAGKVAAVPGTLDITVNPGATFHNANGVPAVFPLGFYYEVVVEGARDLLPAVTVWSSDSAAGYIAGTLIPAGDFVELSPSP